jgi:hypothetical protein
MFAHITLNFDKYFNSSKYQILRLGLVHIVLVVAKVSLPFPTPCCTEKKDTVSHGRG